MREYSISLSKKNMKLLLEHVFLGNWVLTSPEYEEESESDAFLNTILSIMKNYNIEEDIEYDEEAGNYYISDDMEFEFIKKIVKYDQECFWDEMPEKLALRDINESLSREQLESMNEDELFDILEDAKVPYEKEFEKNGLKNLRIRKK